MIKVVGNKYVFSDDDIFLDDYDRYKTRRLLSDFGKLLPKMTGKLSRTLYVGLCFADSELRGIDRIKSTTRRWPLSISVVSNAPFPRLIKHCPEEVKLFEGEFGLEVRLNGYTMRVSYVYEYRPEWDGWVCCRIRCLDPFGAVEIEELRHNGTRGGQQ